MAYDETGGCYIEYVGFSVEIVRFLKPGASHCTQVLITYGRSTAASFLADLSVSGILNMIFSYSSPHGKTDLWCLRKELPT